MKLKIALLPGDGVGAEVTEQAVRVLKKIAEIENHDFAFTEMPIGGVAVKAHNSPLPDETLKVCLESDAVFLGAVGSPEFDHLKGEMRCESGLLRLRRSLGGFANLRPAICYDALADCSPLRREIVAGADFLIVRELLGGLYFGEPRGIESEGANRVGFNTMRYTAREVERVARIAFEAAKKRRGKVTSADKANVLEASQVWRETVVEVAKDYPEIELEHFYVDACAMALVTNPKRFDVILTENLFGDILSDEAAVLTGSLGMLGSATIGGRVGLYEPVHGSAPDIAGKNIANPIGAIASAAMLLRFSAELELSAIRIEQAIVGVLSKDFRTADINVAGGKSIGTIEMGDLILESLERSYEVNHSISAA